MGAKRVLEVGVNEHINRVLRAAMEVGDAATSRTFADGTKIEPEQRASAMLVAGLLTAAKAAIVQAAAVMAEMKLDGICDDAGPNASSALSDAAGRRTEEVPLPVFTMPGSGSASRRAAGEEP
jgi:hypothetical protein